MVVKHGWKMLNYNRNNRNVPQIQNSTTYPEMKPQHANVLSTGYHVTKNTN